MRVSLNWLRSYVDVDLAPEDLAHRLTMAGLEVSSLEPLGEGIDEVVVGQVAEVGPHPNADRLKLCRVTDGSDTYEIVCGASNMAPGDKVALARVGTRLPGGVKIKKSKIRGQTSWGMMCSERELALGEDHSGILILPPDAPLGAPVTEVLDLPDWILEVDLTPNRADCLSVVGVAREVAAITSVALRLPEPRVPETGGPVEAETSVEIRAPGLCHRYAARVIRGVRIGPSPGWMRRRLEALGVRSINNVVDVTNYVLLELGHPLHAFDLNRLSGGRIVVQKAREGEVFTTLDGQERVLDAECLMICDAERPVALAGIMGGLNSEVQDDTVDVLLESAYFEPRNIRRTAKKLGLSTEASYRFERGTDIEGLLRALDRCAELVAELAGGTVARGVWDAYPRPHEPVEVVLRLPKVEAVLGVEVPAERAVGHLERLGIQVLGRDGERVRVRIPTHRVDLEREIDLIEEVARLEGYEAVPTTLPRVPMAGEPLPPAARLADRARDALCACGLREAITYSFVDPGDDDRLGLPEGHPLRSKVELANPLSRETGVMRTSLLPGLLRAAGQNLRRQARDVRLFEVGRTFHPQPGGPLPREVLRAAGVLTGRREPLGWWHKGEAADFYDAKGVAEQVLEALGAAGTRFEAAPDLPWLHPGQAARIQGGGELLGWLGQVHPLRLESYDLGGPVFAFELDLDAVARVAREPGPFTGLARYPAVERDLAIVVDREVAVQAVVDAIASVESPLVRSAVLFDCFEGGRLPPGKVSMAFRVTYRSEERTLTEADVTATEGELLARLQERVGAQLRQA
ncbi:MAG: phenylalanine--tRNA ligase subunit beta [Deferrisomatales bacterium]